MLPQERQVILLRYFFNVMSNISDTATVTLNVNGSQAKQMMSDLESKIKQTEATIAQLKQSMADPKDIEKAKKQLKTYQKQLDEMKSATEGVDRALSNINLATPRQLEKALRTLNRQLKDMVPGSDVWDSHVEKIQELKERLAELREETEAQQTVWEKFKDWSQGAWPALDLIKGWYDNIVSGLREYVDAFAEMDQEMANVRKFTGMTDEEVETLNDAFKKMDTRTSREELNKLAQEAGRLGKTSVEDVLGFVRAADKINVALDDLGEGAALSLSKLTGIFGDEERYGTEQSLLKVGSVINELSQNCSASAPYLAQFTSRLGGVGAQAGMTIQQIMGFAAVLDTNSQALEASATSLSQIIVRLYQDPAKYAKVAGLDAQEFAKLMREDANAALILFLETLQKAGGMDTLSPMFKDMGENGSRAIAALSTLATHIDQVKAQQEAANAAFEEGISIDNEFAVQNGTVQASLEKCKNAANNLKVELGQHLQPIMSHFLTTSSAIMRVLLVVVRFLIQHKAAVVALAAATAAYVVVLKGEIAVKKIREALDTLHYYYLVLQTKATTALTLVTEGLRLVYYKVTGQTMKATMAQKAFNAALASTPWGAILTAIAAFIVALKAMGNATEEVSEKYEALDKAKEDAAVKYNEEKYLLEQNINKIKEFSGTKEQEISLINSLNEKYGPLMGTYSSLSDWLRTLVDRGNDYCLSLQQQIIMEGKLEQARQLIAKAAKMRNEGDGEWNYTEYQSWSDASVDLKNAVIDFVSTGEWGGFMTPKEFVSLENNKYWARAEQKAQQYEAQAAQLRAEAEAMANDAKATFQSAVEVTEETHTPYVPIDQKQIEEDAKKRALAERRALAMAKEEFKQKMDAAKGDFEYGTAQNIMEYGSGLKTYEEFLAEKERLELAYADKRIEIYNNLYEGESETDKQLLLMYDEDYQSFLQKRAELTAKFASEKVKRTVEEYKREYDMERAALEFEFASESSEYYGNAQAQQERLHQLKIEYLKKYRDAYNVNSKEWLEYQAQIDEAEQDRMLQKRKQLMDAYESWVSKYTSISAKRRYEIELALVKELYEQKKISEEQYQLWLAQLREKYSSESDDAASAAADSKYKVNGPGGKVDILSEKEQIQARVAALNKKRDEAFNELKERFDGGLIDEKEYKNGLKAIREAYQDELLRPMRDSLDEQTKMLLDLGVLWYDFFKGISETGRVEFGSLAKAAAASFGVMAACLQTYSQFVEEDKRIAVASAEKRYDREVELAQGNSYKVAKAEKKKEDEIAKVKAEYAKKEFAVKVLMAVAQTAQNALLGYAAGLQAGFPMALWLAPLLAGMATAQGAIQIALLKKQQQAAAEGYSKGGFTKPGGVNEPAGIVHAGEWVASQRLLDSPVARPMIEALDYAQRTNTIGSLRAEDVSHSITATQSLVRISETDAGSAIIAAAASDMTRTVADLTDRLNEPFVTVNTVTGDKGIKQAQDEYSRLVNNVTPKSKQKRSKQKR